ncbi:P-loop containing nucleoside triphosphate hydrolase protein [Cladochytrium replicatum]|nr:P-loop containing nucleoside triphosphate hydrolase protein [Cladochytrium replicatum]
MYEDPTPVPRAYSIAQESRYLVIENVPAFRNTDELLKLFALYGTIEEYHFLDHLAPDLHTDVYLLKFESIAAARVAKRKLDGNIFFASPIVVKYGTEYESVDDLRAKIQQRRLDVEDHKTKWSKDPSKNMDDENKTKRQRIDWPSVTPSSAMSQTSTSTRITRRVDTTNDTAHMPTLPRPPPPPLTPNMTIDLELLKSIRGSTFVDQRQRQSSELGKSKLLESCRAFQFPPELLEHLALVTSDLLSLRMIPLFKQTFTRLLSFNDSMVVCRNQDNRTVSMLLPILSHVFTMSKFFGKTQRGPYAVILCSTRERCANVEETAKSWMQGLPFMRTALVVGGQPLPNQIFRLSQGVQLVVATPGRLLEITRHDKTAAGQFSGVVCICLDEADQLLVGSSGSKDAYDKVKSLIDQLTLGRKRQLVGFVSSMIALESAMKSFKSLARAAPAIIIDEPTSSKVLRVTPSGKRIIPAPPLNPSDVPKHLLLWVENASKKKKLFSLLSDENVLDSPTTTSPVVVIVSAKEGADLLAQAIAVKLGVVALSIHGDKSADDRASILKLFGEHRIAVLVSTAFLAHTAPPGFSKLILFDMAYTVVDFVAQANMVAKQDGVVVTFINDDQRHLFADLVKYVTSLPARRVGPLPAQLQRIQYAQQQ